MTNPPKVPEEKACIKCGVVKPLDQFYKNSTVRDGHLNTCGACRRAEQKLWREQNRQRSREIAANWHDANRARKREINRKHREQHPEKAKAWKAVANAVREGRLHKPNACDVCKESVSAHDLHGHHDDYSKPLEVRWLCRSCHLTLHGRVEQGTPSAATDSVMKGGDGG